MICLHTKFPVPSYNGSIVINIQMKTKCRFYVAIMFYIREKNP